MSENRLTVLQKIAYGLPAFPLGLIGLSYFIFLPKYYNESLAVALAFLSPIILFSRILDAVLDPLVGTLFDRKVEKEKAHHLWIKLSLLPLALSFIVLCSPQILGGMLSSDYIFLFGSLIFFLALTSFSVPFEALGMKLTDSYKERNSIFSWRESFFLLGACFSGVGPALLQSLPEEEIFLYLSLLYSALLILFSLLLLRVVPSSLNLQGAKTLALKTLLMSKNFLLLTLSSILSGMSVALPAALILYFVQYVIGSQHGPGFLAVYFLIGITLVPLWIRLGNAFGKKRAFIASTLVNAVTFLAVLSVETGDELRYGLIVVASALGLGGTLIFPPSLQADLIDEDAEQHGERREAALVGIWSVAKKLAAALAAGGGLWLLSGTGFEAGHEQSEQVKTALRYLYGLLPALLAISSALVLLPYEEKKEDS